MGDSEITGAPSDTESFPKQWEYVKASTKRNTVLCSRRAGKTAGETLRARDFLSRGENVLYVGRVRRNVREQFWVPIKNDLSRLGVAYKTQEQDLVLRPTEGHGMIMGMSCDDVSDIEKGRGFKWGLAIVDEAQSFKDDVLKPLIDLIIIPTLIDVGGSLDLVGTPPDSMDGYFVEAVLSDKWTHFSWSVWDNPHIKEKDVREAYEARGIGPSHNIWEREVEGRMVINKAALVYPFDMSRNGYTEIPS